MDAGTSKRGNAPPVVVELPVTEAKQLRHEVHGRVEEPVEKHQPQQVVGDLGDEKSGSQERKP